MERGEAEGAAEDDGGGDGFMSNSLQKGKKLIICFCYRFRRRLVVKAQDVVNIYFRGNIEFSRVSDPIAFSY